MRVFYFSILCLLVSVASCQQKHPMPNIGRPYVHFWKHYDSVSKIIFDSAGNYRKGWGKDASRICHDAAALDNSDDSIYRVKYHFSDYYYMWNYTDKDRNDEGWGENTITLSRCPTKQEIKDLVWNYFFKSERGSKYSSLEVVEISPSSSNDNTLQNMSGAQKAELNYQKSTYIEFH